MVYQASNARTAFETEIQAISGNLQLIEKQPPIPSAIREYAIAAAIFLSHAEIENFFNDLLEEVARAFSLPNTTSSNLPTSLQAHLIYEKFGLEQFGVRILRRNGEQDNAQAISKWFSSPHKNLLDVSTPLGFNLCGDDIRGPYSYPSIDNIIRVLKRVGVADPRGQLNAELQRDVLGLLRSISDLRTQLAHSAQLPGVSVGDVIQRINDSRAFVQAFDSLIYSTMTGHVSHAEWVSLACVSA